MQPRMEISNDPTVTDSLLCSSVPRHLPGPHDPRDYPRRWPKQYTSRRCGRWLVRALSPRTSALRRSPERVNAVREGSSGYPQGREVVSSKQQRRQPNSSRGQGRLGQCCRGP